MTDSNVSVSTSRYGLEAGSPAVRSVGPITFGPSGILFVADNASAKIFAIDSGDNDPAGESRPIEIARQPALGDGHADARRHALSQGTRGGLDTRCPSVFGMPGAFAFELAKALDVIQRQR